MHLPENREQPGRGPKGQIDSASPPGPLPADPTATKITSDDLSLGRLALERGLLTRQQLEDSIGHQERVSGQPGGASSLAQVFVELGYLKTEQVLGLFQDHSRTLQGIPNIPRYEVQERLGEGATAVVYRARDRELLRPVALKVLRGGSRVNQVARRRFEREAQAAASLSHPNVVAIYDVGETAGQLYLVMELVEGSPLSVILKSRSWETRRLVSLLEKAARGVSAAHEKGIVHRDLKPDNIMVTASGEPKVGDFGLAHLVDEEGELTRTGATLGTPLYMAPEQVGGRSSDVQPATDVHALGVILYEILTTQPPHRGDTLVEIYEKIAKDPPLFPRKLDPEIPADLETIALKALEKDPRKRYPTAGEFAADLGRFLKGDRIDARPVPGWVRKVRSALRFWKIAALAGFLLAVGVLRAPLIRSKEASPAPVATLEEVRGTVSIVGDNGRRLALTGDRIRSGEGIDVEDGRSGATLSFEDGTRLEAGPFAKIDRLADDDARGKRFSITRGSLTASIRSQAIGRPITIAVPNATLQSLEGRLRLMVEPEMTRSVLEAGRLDVRSSKDGRVVEVQPDHEVQIPSLGPPKVEAVPRQAPVLQVGPGKPFLRPSQAAAVATDGSIVEIQAGDYPADVAVWKADHLTLRGVGGRARLQPLGALAENKSIWVVYGDHLKIENIEFSGAHSEPFQGSALYTSSETLTLRGCFFHDNDASLRMVKENPAGDILIEHCEFARNGRPNGSTPTLGVKGATLTLQYSYLHHPRGGHILTSLARTNFILYNRLTAEDVGDSSNAVDLPAGGTAFLVGNLMHQVAHGSSIMVRFGAGVDDSRDAQALYVVHNTMVTEHDNATFVGVHNRPGICRVINNLLVGTGQILDGKGELAGNVVGLHASLSAPASYDYRLLPGSPAIGAGIDPGSVNGFDLSPRFQYLHPLGREVRPARGRIDAGAYAFAETPPPRK